MKYSAKIIHRLEVARMDGTTPLALQSFIGGKRIVLPIHIHVAENCFDKLKQRIITAKGSITQSMAFDYNLLIQQALTRRTL